MGTWDDPAVAAWEAAGRYRQLAGHRIFTVDLAPASPGLEPLLVIHGYPTSSFDFAPLAARLSEDRRVLLLDLLGFGLSDKPDVAYTLAEQADIVEAFVADAGVGSLALLTHDMGDTVGGELLARQEDGTWRAEVTRRVVTNGSIYIEMAHLTAGQQLLLSVADERLPDELAPGRPALAASLAETLSPTSTDARAGLDGHAELVCHGGGNTLLARTIRYIEERRRNQARYTGAIETHPSPLGIVWGTEDPIAVAAMATRLSEARPDASLTWLEGIGHYPMIEAPDDFLTAVRATLG
jgi:pimeloyl-ACP methyl ester carboxylesterase